MTDDSGRHTLDTYDHASQRTCIVGIHCSLSVGNPSGGIEKKKKTGRLNFKMRYSSSIGPTSKRSIQVNSNNMSRDVPL